MAFRLFKIKFLGVFCLAASCFLTGFQTVNAQQSHEIEEELTRALLKDDLGELAETAWRRPASDFAQLWRQLIIFDRAGQLKRAQVAARRLLDIAGAGDQKTVALHIFAAHLDADDFDGWKLFHEQINRCGGTENTGLQRFIELWERRDGAPEEIESWLTERYEKSGAWAKDDCFNALFAWQDKRNRAYILREKLRAEVEANPADLKRAERFLRYARNAQDIEWLAEVFASPKAFDNYWLGHELYIKGRWGIAASAEKRAALLASAAALLERSIKQPFDQNYDVGAIGQWMFVRVAVQPVIRNYEKQLRFWTKEKLAEIYTESGQPQLAQPIAEELAKMDKSDLLDADVGRLAGAVQAASGMRVVEAKILQEEATKSSMAAYWVERLEYYRGRKEPELIRQTFTAALAALAFKQRDSQANRERFRIVYDYIRYLEEDVCKKDGDRCAEAVSFLEGEFAAANGEPAYQHEILKMARNDFENLIERWFAADPDLLVRILTAERDWEYNNFISEVAQNDKISPPKKQQLWQRLEALANAGHPNQKFYLAVEMLEINENERAIRLLLDCLKRVPADDEEAIENKFEFFRDDAYGKLFQAHLQTGNWRAAEKLLFAADFAHWTELPGKIEEIAVVAANRNAVPDAVRLWKLRANIDRRQIDGLSELAKTGAKSALREFYLEMKRRDAESFVPDLALQKLQ